MKLATITALFLLLSATAGRAYGPGCPYTNAQPPVLAGTNPLLHVSMKWCGLAEAPMMKDPANIACRPTYKDALWQRHERASDLIWIPQAQLTLRSGAFGFDLHTNFVKMDDPDLTIGLPGDVVISP